MVKQRGDVWYAVLYLPDESGKKRQRWISLPLCRNERMARSEEARLKVELSKKPITTSKQTVGAYLEQWLQKSKSRLRAKTYEGYETKIRIYLVPELGSIPLSKLTSQQIEDAYDRLLDRPLMRHRAGTSQTLSPQTVINTHRLLNAALNRAVKQRRLEWNPASAVAPPKTQAKEVTARAIEEIVPLLRATREKHDLYYMPIYLALTTGLRRGEVLGLRWTDVNLEKGTLTVNQAIEQTKENGIGFGEPKTKGSRRTLIIPSVFVEALREHKMLQKERMASKGIIQTDFCLVCCHASGKPISPGGFSHGFATLLKKLGIRPMRFHDLRHSHASILIAQGAPIKGIASRLGHASSKLTNDVYGHLLTGVEEGMVANLDQSIRHAMEDHLKANGGGS